MLSAKVQELQLANARLEASARQQPALQDVSNFKDLVPVFGISNCTPTYFARLLDMKRVSMDEIASFLEGHDPGALLRNRDLGPDLSAAQSIAKDCELLRAALAQQRQKNHEQDREITTLRIELEEKIRNINLLTGELHQLSLRLNLKDKEDYRLNTKDRGDSDEVERLKRELHLTRNLVTTLRQPGKIDPAEMERLRRELAETKAQLEQLKKGEYVEIGRLTRELEFTKRNAYTEISKLKSELAERRSESSKEGQDQFEKLQLQKDVQECQNEKMRLQKEADDAKNQLQRSLTRIQDQEREMFGLKKRIEELEQLNRKLNDDLAKSDAASRVLQFDPAPPAKPEVKPPQMAGIGLLLEKGSTTGNILVTKIIPG